LSQPGQKWAFRFADDAHRIIAITHTATRLLANHLSILRKSVLQAVLDIDWPTSNVFKRRFEGSPVVSHPISRKTDFIPLILGAVYDVAWSGWLRCYWRD
jgi:hypothetical protein